jgi:hypothetical protein
VLVIFFYLRISSLNQQLPRQLLFCAKREKENLLPAISEKSSKKEKML